MRYIQPIIRYFSVMNTRISTKLVAALNPHFIEIINESHRHNVPAGSETHFKVVVVSSLFENKSLVERHRSVNTLLKEELANGVHALSIQAKTVSEWEASPTVTATPNCLGGMKREK